MYKTFANVCTFVSYVEVSKLCFCKCNICVHIVVRDTDDVALCTCRWVQL